MGMDIQHDVRQRKFYSIVKGTEYSLEYNETESGLWEFHCPYMPENRKERDVLDKLIEYALYYMRRNRIKLLEPASCMHVKDFMDRRGELLELVYVG